MAPVKGRPPQLARIEALESQLADIAKAVRALELRLNIPTLNEAYRPQFDKWPGN